MLLLIAAMVGAAQSGSDLHGALSRPNERLIFPSLAIDDAANNRSTAGGAMMLGPPHGFSPVQQDNYTAALLFGNSSSSRRGLQTCPPGTEDLMGTGESCISCAPGRYDDDNDPNTFCNACGAGQVAEGGTTFCVTCPTGTYAEPGSYNGQSMGLTAGTLEKGTGCFQCANGKYSADVAGGCDICESGWYDHDSNPSTPCIICHVGSYTVPGVTECEDCVPGRYDNDKQTNTPCVACDIGTYANYTVFGTTRKEQLLRQAGEDIAGAAMWLAKLEPPRCGGEASTAECHQAEVENEMLMETSCEECEPGQHDHDQDPATPCEYCGAGKVSWSGVSTADEAYNQVPELELWIGRGTWKSDHCEACTAGMYAKFMQPSCEDCLGGSYTPEDGMDRCDICEKGTMSEDKSSSCEICPIGTFAAQRNQSFCALCAVGQYGNGTKADKCVFCPDGTGHTKEGGTRLRSCCKPGTWADAADQGHETCYDCATPAMCIGNGECDLGREGNWCATCMDRWFAMNQKCYECPDNSAPMVVAALAMFIGLSFAVVNIATTKKGGGKAQSSSIVKEVGATPMSILFTRLQISLPVFKLGMDWPPWLTGYFAGFKGLISLDVSAMTAPECFTTGDPAAMYLSRSVTKLFLFPMLMVQMTIVFFIMQKFIWKPRGLEVRNTNVINAWVAAYSFLFVMLATSGFEPFDCAAVEGVFLLNAQREILCYEGQWLFIAFIGVMILTIYAVVVPTFLFRALLKMRVSHFGDNILRTEKNIELKARFGWIYERYRPAAWYYEFVMIFQRIASIGIAQVFGAQGSSTEGWVCYFTLTVFVLRIQMQTKPYPEIVVDTESLFNSPNIPKVIKKFLKTTPRYLSWNNMEQLGIYAQLVSLMVGLYFALFNDKTSPIALFFGLVTIVGYMTFITANLVAVALRVWALTREGNKYYEEGTRTPLHDYAEEDLLSKCFDEMSKGVDINGLDEDNETPLYIATKGGHLRVITALINGGADPNLGCGAGRWCTLHVATNCETVKLLFIGGADATLQDSWGKTAEDVQREESEIPPIPKKGQRQTQADRDKYKRERLKMAEMIADRSARRPCDWAWKAFCPSRRTRKTTPYGEIMKDKPKRPGMGKMGGSKEEIMRFFYKKYGSEVQVKQVESVLRTVLVGETEEQNYDLFELYCKKIEQTHGRNPRDVWRARTDEDKEELENRARINLDGYGGSGQTGKVCAKSFKADDYKIQRGLSVDDDDGVFTGGKLPWHKEDDESSEYSGYSDYISDEDEEGEDGSLPGQTVDVHLKLANMKIAAREKAKAKKETERLKHVRKVKKSGLLGGVKGANTSKQESKLRTTGEIDADGNILSPKDKVGGMMVESYKSSGGNSPTGVSFNVRSESLLERMARNQEDWIQNALNRNSTGKEKTSIRTKSVKILDKKSFRKAKSYRVKETTSAPAPATGGGGGGGGGGSSPPPPQGRSFRNHNRAMSFVDKSKGNRK